MAERPVGSTLPCKVGDGDLAGSDELRGACHQGFQQALDVRHENCLPGFRVLLCLPEVDDEATCGSHIDFDAARVAGLR